MSIEIHGIAELVRKLTSLPTRLAAKHMRAAMASGAKLIAQDAKSMAPVHEGPYPPSRTRVFAGKYGAVKRSKSTGRLRAGPRKGLPSYQLRRPGTLKRGISYRVTWGGDIFRAKIGFTPLAYYGAILERGGKHWRGGVIAARPMISSAMERSHGKAVAAITDRLRQAVDLEVSNG